MEKEELLEKINTRHWKLFNYNYEDQTLEGIDFRKTVKLNTDLVCAILDWAVERANMEFEVYDDISFGEVIAAQEVYEILKRELS